MNLKKLFALGGVTLMLAALPAAASATKVTVRVEGLNHTLLAPRHINVHNGWITRYGAPEGQCPASSAQGALDVGTRHRWRGTWTTQFGPEYEITSILGETHRFTSKYFLRATEYRVTYALTPGRPDPRHPWCTSEARAWRAACLRLGLRAGPD